MVANRARYRDKDRGADKDRQEREREKEGGVKHRGSRKEGWLRWGDREGDGERGKWQTGPDVAIRTHVRERKVSKRHTSST